LKWVYKRSWTQKHQNCSFWAISMRNIILGKDFSSAFVCDVGDLQLVIILVGDRIKILVTSFGCCCPTIMLIDKGWWWPKWRKPSPTSWNCHSHISSSTSVTNIDVADGQRSEINQLWKLSWFYLHQWMVTWSYRTEESFRIQWNIWREWCSTRIGSEISISSLLSNHCNVFLWGLRFYERPQVTIFALRWPYDRFKISWSNESQIFPTNIWWISFFDHEDPLQNILQNEKLFS